MKRRRFKQTQSLEERLAKEAKRLRKEAKLLPPGAVCGIRGKAATDSDGKRSPIPIESGQPIRTKAATLLIG
ncbi:hypothetical protein [Bradyrhizobium sp. AZCC 1693]|uniref:hypothetical protein n=1 Tax=Bradyrhizobium sp. AZCC 1693 TaxID=3117029 RepID=UPI002FF372A0